MKKEYVFGGPIPESLGHTADLYKEVAELRLAMQKEVDKVKKRESELREYLIDNISKSDDRGAVGQRYKAIVKTKTKFSTTDWNAAFQWAVKNGRTDIFSKSLNSKPLADYMEETGHPIPGTEPIHVPDLSVTKI